MIAELLSLGFVFCLLLLSAYFASCETALTAYSKPKMFSIAQSGNKKAKVIISLQADITLVLSAILTCCTIINALVVSLSNSLFVDIFGESAIFYGPIIVSIFIVLFAEVLPKMLTITDPEKILLPSAYFIKYLYICLKPLNKVIAFVSDGIIKLIHVRSKNKEEQYQASLEELKGAIDLHEGLNENDTKQEKAMLRSILDLSSVDVRSIMVHRKNVTMFSVDLPIDEITNCVLNCPFTRIPLWKGNPDNIIGILHAKDFLKTIKTISLDKIDVKKILLKPHFIPEDKDLLAQLQSFKSNREHFAVVVDEYGGVMGIITLEDIIEEIVGDIADEHDVAITNSIRKQSDGSYIVSGNTNIRDLNREINSNLRSKDVATVAGLVINAIGIIPNIGQVFIIDEYKFEILKKYRNQITLLRLKKMKMS